MQKDLSQDLQLDQESSVCLKQMSQPESISTHRLSGIKSVLVVLSPRGMVFDKEALRQQIIHSYPEAAVFFQATLGKPVGAQAPGLVDLLIDFTGPGQREGFFDSRKLKKRARFSVGRNAGFFRKRIYDRIYDEKVLSAQIPQEMLAGERWVQKNVLALAGIGFVQAGEILPDRSKSIALELPGIQRL